MSDTPIDRLNRERAAMDDTELAEKASDIVAAMCEGDKWRMSIPVHRDDSDMILSELLRRFTTDRTALATLRDAVGSFLLAWCLHDVRSRAVSEAVATLAALTADHEEGGT